MLNLAKLFCMRPAHALAIGLTATLAATLTPPEAAAQQPSPAARGTAKAAPQQKAEPAASGEAARGDQALRLRIEQLEEQLADMQVMLGTLESMGRAGGGTSAAGRTPAMSSSQGDDTRFAALEAQVRQLQAQVEQLSQQGRNPGTRPVPQPTASAGFGTPVSPQSERDPIGQIMRQTETSAPSLPQSSASDASAKQMYESAYGQLLNQDYAAAETGFEDFLRRFPNDQLAGNAQYWLGESLFVRGQFKAAAGAFLKGYQTYARSSKAPDSLLKLAMSLDRLGQRDGACSAYGELGSKFPNAPGSIKLRADSERRRLGCA